MALAGSPSRVTLKRSLSQICQDEERTSSAVDITEYTSPISKVRDIATYKRKITVLYYSFDKSTNVYSGVVILIHVLFSV